MNIYCDDCLHRTELNHECKQDATLRPASNNVHQLNSALLVFQIMCAGIHILPLGFEMQTHTKKPCTKHLPKTNHAVLPHVSSLAEISILLQ